MRESWIQEIRGFSREFVQTDLLTIYSGPVVIFWAAQMFSYLHKRSFVINFLFKFINMWICFYTYVLPVVIRLYIRLLLTYLPTYLHTYFLKTQEIEDWFQHLMIMIMTSGWGLQQRPTSRITKKYSTLKIKLTMKQYKSYTRVKSKRRISFTE